MPKWNPTVHCRIQNQPTPALEYYVMKTYGGVEE